MTDKNDKKIARIQFTIEFDYPIFDATNEEIKFYLEENHCFENYMDFLNDQREIGTCIMCSIATAKVLSIKDNDGDLC